MKSSVSSANLRRKIKTKFVLTKIFLYTTLIIGTITCLLPMYWLVRSSFMNMGQIFQSPPVWIPDPFVPTNFRDAFEAIPFLLYFKNTLTIVISVVFGSVLTSALCAYSFARLRWRGRNFFFMLIISSMMMPATVTMIPIFMGWRLVGLTNTLIPLTLPVWFGGGAFNVFLMRQFMMGIPRDLDEAATIDGASHFRIFSQIILPSSKSAMIVVGLFAFLNSWNDFMGPLIYLSDQSKYTLSLGLSLFKGMYSAQWHLLMAAATMILLPAVIVFFIGQRYIIEGVSMSGIKG